VLPASALSEFALAGGGSLLSPAGGLSIAAPPTGTFEFALVPPPPSATPRVEVLWSAGGPACSPTFRSSTLHALAHTDRNPRSTIPRQGRAAEGIPGRCGAVGLDTAFFIEARVRQLGGSGELISAAGRKAMESVPSRGKETPHATDGNSNTPRPPA
jgi:hypothetical protein